MSWTCTQFENLLSDYREGLLSSADAAAARQHLSGCDPCSSLLAAVAALQDQLTQLPQLEPPPRLLAAIMATARARSRRPAPLGALGQRWQAIWAACTSPRFALGVAMSVFVFALLLNVTQVNLRQVFQPGGMSQLSPSSLTSSLQRHVDRAWARGVSYYHDLRVVYEIEAAVHQMRQQAPPAAASPAGPGAGPGANDRSQRELGSHTLLARIDTPDLNGGQP